MVRPHPMNESEVMTLATLHPIAAPRRLRPVPLLFVGAGLALLGGALFIEHGLGIRPCILCEYQRIPPLVVIVLAAVAAWPGLPRPWARALLGLVALVFLGGAVLAGYHVGVEQHWWAGTDQCGGADAPPSEVSTSLADLRAALAAPEIVPCDAVPWSLFGISLAGFNLILSLGLSAVALWAVRRPAAWRNDR